jgi:hypothetical protein
MTRTRSGLLKGKLMNGAYLLSYLVPALTTLIGVALGAYISGKSWNRQRQWEMRRDAVFEAVRALGELEYALVDLHSIYSFPCSIPTSELKDLKTYTLSKRLEKREKFDSCNAKINGAMFLTDMVVGEMLGKALCDCVNEMRSIVLKILKGDTAYFMRSESKEALAHKIKAVNVAARKELKLVNAALRAVDKN